MRITIEKQSTGAGYFPGLAKPRVLDSSVLSPLEQRELERLVDAAKFFELPPEVAPRVRGAADYTEQTITIERDGETRAVHLSDLATKPDSLKNLLEFIARRAKP